MSNVDFVQKFDSFLVGVNKIVEDYRKNNFPTLPLEPIVATEGKRYIRLVVVRNGVHASCYGFVDKQTGDVLKSASWKAPAKGARGNIFDQANGLGRVGPYGLEYNK